MNNRRIKEHYNKEKRDDLSVGEKILSAGQLGARVLNQKEIELSLPTYPKLLSQIEEIRSDVKLKQRKDSETQYSVFTQGQVTNNIAILGPRGSGKTSILKTLYQELEEQNKIEYEASGTIKNVLLPSIVPENMSDSVTLMSTLLGLLEEPVRQYADRQKKTRSHHDSCPVGKSRLEKDYNKLVEDYIHLQEPYQSVAVEHYSTDWEYLQRMIGVYKSGNQFTERFHGFIEQLLEEEKDALLFVFIDDIDLSTSRCTDVVKTLLAYVAHPRIVTVLAGDLDTFDEALTLDFLRQEKLTDSEAMGKIFLLNSRDEQQDALLERKKKLAYEYMKKIMPPIYRHHVFQWSLGVRGQFQPVRYSEDGTESNTTLAELLSGIGKKNPLLRGYFQNSTKQEAAEKEDSEGAIRKSFVTYHLFDSSSRGLANAYVAIEQLVQAYEPDKSREEKFRMVKSALETIIFSNPMLNQYRSWILDKFLRFGISAETTEIRFDSYSEWMKSDMDISLMKTCEREETENKNRRTMELGVFSAFLYLDFAVRALEREEILHTQTYQSAKYRALFLLCTNNQVSDGEKIHSDKWLDLIKELRLSDKNLRDNTLKKDLNVKKVNSLMLFEFPLALQYFANLVFDKSKTTFSKQDILNDIYCFLGVIEAYFLWEHTSKEYARIGRVLEDHKAMVELIDNHLQENKDAMLLSVLCDDYFSKSFLVYQQYRMLAGRSGDFAHINTYLLSKYLNISDLYPYSLLDKTWKSEIETSSAAGNGRIFPLYNLYTNVIFKEFFHDYRGFDYHDKLSLPQGTEDDDMRTRVEIIRAVGRNRLWREDESERIFAYIEGKLKSAEKAFLTKNNQMQINIPEACCVFRNQFSHLYTGSTSTLSAKCKVLLEEILGPSDGNEELRCHIQVSEYVLIRMILERLVYSGAWYGKAEARAVLTALNSAQAEFLTDDVEDNDLLREQYLFWLWCYTGRQAEVNDQMSALVDAVHGKLEMVQTAHKSFQNERIEGYRNKLIQGTDMTPEELRKALDLFE